MSRWITIVLPGDYKKNNYQSIYAVYINPIILSHKGSEHKCVYDEFTESEHKFKSLLDAKKRSKELNLLFKKLIKKMPFLFGKDKFISKPMSYVMAEYYEKYGERTIIRPTIGESGTYKAKLCKSFKSTLFLSDKYKNRPSPPFPANKYPNKIMQGNDGKMYKSLPNLNKIYSWKNF